MSMRKQLVQTVQATLDTDDKCVVLLGDIGVFGFKEAFQSHPDRVYNIGILEPATIGLAAGMAITGLVPIVHTIAPFLVERALEQIKVDFCYQNLGGNFVSVGGSYDYAALGCTHHCPGDVGILKTLPRMEIVLPGSAREFDQLFRQSYDNGNPTYFRLSEREHSFDIGDVDFGKAKVLKTGSMATVIAVGPSLSAVWPAVSDLDVTVLYYTCISPFDRGALRENCSSGKILLCEPYYMGGADHELLEAMEARPVAIEHIGVPLEFRTNYGTADEHDKAIGMTPDMIRRRLINFAYKKD